MSPIHGSPRRGARVLTEVRFFSVFAVTALSWRVTGLTRASGPRLHLRREGIAMTNALVRKLESVVPLPAGDRRALELLCSRSRRLEAGKYILHEGDRPEDVHLILEGWAARHVVLEDGSRQITAFLLPGDLCDQHVTILGEMDHGIVTLTPTLVASLPNGELDELARERPDLARALWWSTLVDEAVLRAWITNIGRRPAYQRLAHLICELHVRLQVVGLADRDTFQFPLTQQDLADALGLTPVHINRVLRRLRTERLIVLERRRLTVADVERLRELAGFTLVYLHDRVRPRLKLRPPQIDRPIVLESGALRRASPNG